MTTSSPTPGSDGLLLQREFSPQSPLLVLVQVTVAAPADAPRPANAADANSVDAKRDLIDPVGRHGRRVPPRICALNTHDMRLHSTIHTPFGQAESYRT